MQNRNLFASPSSPPTTITTPSSDTSSRLRQDDDLDIGEGASQAKKPRRAPGACDTCRRKKIRCDSTQTQDNQCTNCKSAGIECTHKAVGRSLGVAKGYVESLEARLEKMDKLLTTLLPGIDFNQELDKLDHLEEVKPDVLPRNDHDRNEYELSTSLSKLKLDPSTNRFFGKSSNIQLLQTVLDVKSIKYDSVYDDEFADWKRSVYWDTPYWAGQDYMYDQWAGKPSYTYPPADLLASLIDLYFLHMNPYMPLLHRPTFERLVTEGLHHANRAFAATVLLVCANGAKYSDDPRVLSPGTDSWLSAGWKYYEQVKVLRESTHARATLHELQAFALHAQYTAGSPAVHGLWIEVGVALRLAIEVGAHRKRPRAAPTVEDELWKRVFWVLLILDRRYSASSGRNCGIHEDEFDLDYPVECDDEYWDKHFAQPDGVPSTVQYLNNYIRLMEILGDAMRFIYSIKRPRNLFYSGAARSDQELIAELDSRMNQWMETLPAHLKWQQNHASDIFRRQSACLHASYYYLTIFIHRPFVPSPRNPTPSNFPSLAICTNAARSCCHVLETFSNGSILQPTFEASMTVSIILLLNIWSGKRTGHAPNPKRELEGVSRCLKIMENAEKRWFMPGRHRDIIQLMITVGGESIEEIHRASERPSSGKKRARDDTQGINISVQSPDSSTSAPYTNQPRSVAGSKRVSRSIHDHPSPTSSDELNTPAPNYLLPTSTNELGRLPIYGQFNFLDSSSPSLPNTSPIWPAGTSNLEAGDQAFFAPFTQSATSGQPPKPFTNGGIPFVAGQTSVPLHVDPTGGMLNYDSLFGLPSSDPCSVRPQPAFDEDIMMMWSTAPHNMSLDDWSLYVSNLQHMTVPQSSSNQAL